MCVHHTTLDLIFIVIVLRIQRRCITSEYKLQTNIWKNVDLTNSVQHEMILWLWRKTYSPPKTEMVGYYKCSVPFILFIFHYDSQLKIIPYPALLVSNAISISSNVSFVQQEHDGCL